MRLSTYWTLLKTFSWQELRLHPWRHAMAVLAVMLGVGLALSVQLINASALSEFSAASQSASGEPDAQTQEVLGVAVRKVLIPVAAGRNLAVLLEAAVRNTILQLRGIDSMQDFMDRQQRIMLDDDA